jgi:chemotaxis protein methyltransferase CheR
MTPREFAYLAAILKQRSGLNLGPDTRELMEGRLQPLLREGAFPSVAALVRALKKPDAEALKGRLAEAITVQESYFFRDKLPFQRFADVMLPALMRSREVTRRIKVWCAAAATGQEPYSLAMLIAERRRELSGFSVDILATDFAETALRKARDGIYSQFEVQRGLPVSLLVKYFAKQGRGWELDPTIRAKVKFAAHNLIADAEFGVFDVIFCRNVLIYFDAETKRDVLARLARQLAGDGYLVLGASETTTGSSDAFQPMGEDHCGIFRLKRAAAVAAA